MIELTETVFGGALRDALQAGREIERDRILGILNVDYYLRHNLTTEQMAHIVEIVEAPNVQE